MSDSYQAIYDAVRSRIQGGNIGEVVAEQVRQAFDISWMKDRIQQEFLTAAQEMQRPFMLLRPALAPDGNHWCALYGENLQEGIAGFGETPDLAAADFDRNWRTYKLQATP